MELGRGGIDTQLRNREKKRVCIKMAVVQVCMLKCARKHRIWNNHKVLFTASAQFGCICVHIHELWESTIKVCLLVVWFLAYLLVLEHVM